MEDEIKLLENELGCELSQEFKYFLLNIDEKRPFPNTFRVESLSENFVFDIFFNLMPESQYNIIQYYRLLRTGIPSGFLPIGRDQLGNYILLGVSNAHKNQICFILHDSLSTSAAKLRKKDIHFLSRNIEEFRNSFFEDEKVSDKGIVSLFDNNELQKITNLIDSGWDPNSKLENGQTPIQRASVLGNFDLIRLLVEKNVDLDGALFFAINTNQTEAVELLILNGASISEIDDFGNTPIHDAVLGKKNEILKRMINLGCDMNVKDEFEETPLQLAQLKLAQGDEDYSEICKMLESAQNKQNNIGNQ